MTKVINNKFIFLKIKKRKGKYVETNMTKEIKTESETKAKRTKKIF